MEATHCALVTAGAEAHKCKCLYTILLVLLAELVSWRRCESASRLHGAPPSGDAAGAAAERAVAAAAAAVAAVGAAVVLLLALLLDRLEGPSQRQHLRAHRHLGLAVRSRAHAAAGEPAGDGGRVHGGGGRVLLRRRRVRYLRLRILERKNQGDRTVHSQILTHAGRTRVPRHLRVCACGEIAMEDLWILRMEHHKALVDLRGHHDTHDISKLLHAFTHKLIIIWSN